MNIERGRGVIYATELEHLARCPRAINYLERIQTNTVCKRCKIFAETAKFILQKNFKGGNLPSETGIVKHFEKVKNKLGISTKTTTKDVVMLHELLIWGKGVADNINMVSPAAETHFGHFTVIDNIDAIIFDMGEYTVVQFSCDKEHQEKIINYRTMHASYWLRNTYDVETNNIMTIKLTDEGIHSHRYPLKISTNSIHQSIIHILSSITNISEITNQVIDLPSVYGEYCWNCLGCFDKE